MEVLYKSISVALNSGLTIAFIIIILAFLIIGGLLGLAGRYTNENFYKRTNRFVSFTPVAMTTIGVIGTFVGIFVGLVDFDVSDIDESVPQLLAGLKIAFATSIFGMVCATFFRFLEHTSRVILGSRPTSAENADPVQVLQAIKLSIDVQTRALVGQNENSIASTLQKTRLDLKDGFDGQIKAFNEFAEQMKEGATEKIVEALKDAIIGFNDKITEQFGDNFKELNSAVGNLNTWQQEYKTQINQTQSALKEQVESLKNISENVSALSEEAKTLPVAAEKMSQANSEILQNFASMNSLLQSLSNIKSNAEVVLPTIEKSLSKTTAVMENASKEMEETMRQTLEKTQKGINANFKTFDEQMQQELSKVLEQMGTNLTSLSGKFVEDYGPLTEKLQRLVQGMGRAAE